MIVSRRTKKRGYLNKPRLSAAAEPSGAAIGIDEILGRDTDELEGQDDVAKAIAPLSAQSNDDIIAMNLRELPFLDRGANGDVRNGFMIDYWLHADGHLLLSGWVIGERFAELLHDERASPGVRICTFPRSDVEMAFPDLHTTCHGVLAVVPTKHDSFQFFGQYLWTPQQPPEDGERIWVDHIARLGFLLEHGHCTEKMRAVLAGQLRSAPEGNRRARGHLEQAKGVPGHGGLVAGWAVALPGVKLALMDAHGHIEWLTKPVRWHRPDIVDAFGFEFGNFSFNAGLLQAWQHDLTLGEDIRLVALDGHSCSVLASLAWQPAPIEPTSFARWAFELPTPLDQFFNRMDSHDGAIIGSLISEKLASRLVASPEITTFGHPAKNPSCSIIIPLYGRFDFMLNQLLEFSEDEELKAKAEIIYVVDDPRILSDIKQQAWLLYESNRVPFKIVTLGENRGYSGANNLGISVSRAPFVLLLNSDVIPVESGWLGKMLAAFDEKGAVGIVGARLFYPNGSIQHDGMTFVWHPELNAHVNKHPGMGMEPSATDVNPTPRLAVTGACLMMKRGLYDDVGGLDETFLIGDFEDSDLCLKVRKKGKSIVCVEDVNLVHLERQSLATIGQGRFRDLVVRYNAWKHERKWNETLLAIGQGADK